MTHPLRIAVAGAGLIGQAHIKRIIEEPEAVLASITDPSPKAREQAASLGVPSYPDLEAALQTDKPDGVVIATPNQLHVPNGLAAVRAGVPMLLEKPVSGDVASALELVEAGGGRRRRRSGRASPPGQPADPARERDRLVRPPGHDHHRYRHVPVSQAGGQVLRRLVFMAARAGRRSC